MKLLITGTTIHSRQYIESFMFDSDIELFFYPDNGGEVLDEIKRYGIEVLDEIEVIKKIRSIDIVVVSNYLDNKLQVLKLLEELNFEGNYIIEKPFAADKCKWLLKLNYLKGKKYIVAYSRQLYEENIINCVKDCYHNELLWPNFYELGIDIIKDTIPHVLDFLLIINERRSFQISILEKNSERVIFDAILEKCKLKVIVYNTNNNEEMVKIGNVKLQWPNYFHYNRLLLKSLNDENFVKRNNRANIIINDLFCEFLEIGEII